MPHTMSRNKDPECRAYLVRETDDAILVCKGGSAQGETNWWIPKSQIGYRRTDRLHETGKMDFVVFTIPEWLIEKKQCWELCP